MLRGDLYIPVCAQLPHDSVGKATRKEAKHGSKATHSGVERAWSSDFIIKSNSSLLPPSSTGGNGLSASWHSGCGFYVPVKENHTDSLGLLG